ncbi:MAG: hypothetical protein BGN93_15015 [Acinetobacter sp. 39-4]|nr:MAG: hypothetical protein BGN93_15015 [Acinetobacter sp. 39-4]OJU91145.1 MAG: hypothetical protein BGO19_08855 [Acinetobacter sp. 38-8]
MKLIIEANELNSALAQHLALHYGLQIDPSQITLPDLSDAVIQIDPTAPAAIADLDADTKAKVKRRGRSDVKTEAVAVEADVEVAATPVNEAEIVDVQDTASVVETEDPLVPPNKAVSIFD